MMYTYSPSTKSEVGVSYGNVIITTTWAINRYLLFFIAASFFSFTTLAGKVNRYYHSFKIIVPTIVPTNKFQYNMIGSVNNQFSTPCISVDAGT